MKSLPHRHLLTLQQFFRYSTSDMKRLSCHIKADRAASFQLQTRVLLAENAGLGRWKFTIDFRLQSSYLKRNGRRQSITQPTPLYSSSLRRLLPRLFSRSHHYHPENLSKSPTTMSLKNSAAAARYAHYARVTIMEPGLDASDDNSQAQGLIDLDLEDPPTTTRALFHFVCHQINSGYPVFWDEVAFSIGLLSESCDQVHQFYDQEMALLKEGERLIVEGKARRSLTRKMYKSIGRVSRQGMIHYGGR